LIAIKTFAHQALLFYQKKNQKQPIKSKLLYVDTNELDLIRLKKGSYLGHKQTAFHSERNFLTGSAFIHKQTLSYLCVWELHLGPIRWVWVLRAKTPNYEKLFRPIVLSMRIATDIGENNSKKSQIFS